MAKKVQSKAKEGTEDLISASAGSKLLMIQAGEFEAIEKAGWFSPASSNPTRYRLVDVVQGHIKYLKQDANRGRTAAEVAKHIDLSTRRVVDLLNSGVIDRKERAGYNLDDVRVQYLRHLRSVASGHGQSGPQSLANERAALTREQRDNVAIRNAIARGEYVALADVKQFNSRVFSVIRENLLTLPGKLGDELAMRERSDVTSRLEIEIHEALNELAEPDTYGTPPDLGEDPGDDEDLEGAAETDAD